MLRRFVVGFVSAILVIVVAAVLALRPPRVSVPPQVDFALENVTAVQPGEWRRPGQTIRVRDGLIVSVEDFSGARSSEAGYSGHYVLPGLIDMHVHHPPAFAWGERKLFALLFLAHGVTSVRDTGSIVSDLRGFRDSVRAGVIPVPRLFLCGPFLDGNPPKWPNSLVIEDAESAEAAIANLIADGFDCAKLYNGLSANVIEALRGAARPHGFSLVAHVPPRIPLRGMANIEVQHLMGTTPHWISVETHQLESVVETSREVGIRHTPTVVTYDRASALAEGGPKPGPALSQALPRYYRELLWNPKTNPELYSLTNARFEDLPARVMHMRSLVGRLHTEGVPIFAGTDTPNPFVVPGESLHRELELLADSGLGTEGAWRAATRVAGRALGLEKLGSLEPGAPADFLVFREDPTRNLGAMSTLVAIVSRGRAYRKETLDAALARYQAHFEGFAYDHLSTATVRFALWWRSR